MAIGRLGVASSSYHSIDSTRLSDSRRRTRPETQMGIRDAERRAICSRSVLDGARGRSPKRFTTTCTFIASHGWSMDTRLCAAPYGWKNTDYAASWASRDLYR
jgi:hypothetical protein